MPDYNLLPGVRSSDLKLMLTSPLAYQYHLVNGREETPAMRLGTATHCAILEPERFAETYRVRSKGNRVLPGTLSADEYERLMAMQRAMMNHELARQYLNSIVAVEEPFQWVDEETGIELKCKPDCRFVDNGLGDVKTTKSADPRMFASDAAKYGYAFSAAMYWDGMTANGLEPSEFVLFAVESVPPHDVVIYRLDDDVLDLGRELYRTCLTRLAKCRESGRYPGRCETKMDLVLPQWAYPTEKPETLKGWVGLEHETEEEG
jgi:exodeoxyribonuclease VIII